MTTQFSFLLSLLVLLVAITIYLTHIDTVENDTGKIPAKQQHRNNEWKYENRFLFRIKKTETKHETNKTRKKKEKEEKFL